MATSNVRVRRHIAILERRRDYLKSLSDKNSWDLAEMGALTFALKALNDVYGDGDGDHGR
jgi:hypothetical protein